jgi:GNAT superfamily N-acetyltransferase
VVKGRVARKHPAVPEELELVYRLEERIPLDGGAPSRHVERWAVSVLLDRPASGDLRAEIGYAHVLVFTLEPGRDIREFADRASGTWIDVEARADAPRSPADPDHDPERTGHIVLLDRVWLEPDHRGRGLGPIVAAAALARLGRGCHLAACYPAPFEGAARRPEDQARAVVALGRVWSKVGFRHWRDGVWMLDLTANDMHATLAELVAARSGSTRSMT